MRSNGHLLLNAEKMSKSTGNFKTLAQAIQEYSADAMRIALADAGDAMDDANFEHQTANGAILRLTKELTWIEEIIGSLDTLRDEEPTSFIDRVFENELKFAVHVTKEKYDQYLFREALKYGVYDLQIARDQYRYACGAEGMNRRLVLMYIDWSTRLLAPICPHLCEHIWRDLLKHDGFVIKAGWPQVDKPDLMLQQMSQYLERKIHELRKSIIKAELPAKARKGEPAVAPPGPVYACELIVPTEYGGWQAKALTMLSDIYEAHENEGRPNGKCFPDGLMGIIMAKVREDKSLMELGPKSIKSMIMPFFKSKSDVAEISGKAALEVRLPFDECALLAENLSYLERALNLESISIRSVSYEDQQSESNPLISSASPGSPASIFSHKNG